MYLKPFLLVIKVTTKERGRLVWFGRYGTDKKEDGRAEKVDRRSRI